MREGIDDLQGDHEQWSSVREKVMGRDQLENVSWKLIDNGRFSQTRLHHDSIANKSHTDLRRTNHSILQKQFLGIVKGGIIAS